MLKNFLFLYDFFIKIGGLKTHVREVSYMSMEMTIELKYFEIKNCVFQNC